MGDMGIGTSEPKAKLDVWKHDGTAKIKVHTNQYNGYAELEIAGGSAYSDPNSPYSGFTFLHSKNHTGNNLYLKYGESGDPEFSFTNTGRIGVGILEPKAAIHIPGNYHGGQLQFQ